MNQILSWVRNINPVLRGVVLGVIFFAVIVYLGLTVLAEKPPHPCDKTQLPGRCYTIPHDACEIFLKNIDVECKAFVSGVVTSPSQLTGAIFSKCRLAKFDKSNYRIRSFDPNCTEFFQDIEGWRKRNME